MINRGLLKRTDRKEWVLKNNRTLLECNFGGCNVGEQAQASQQRLGSKVVERLRCDVCMSMNRLYIENHNQISISADKIEKL